MAVVEFPVDFTSTIEQAVWARGGTSLRDGREVRFSCVAHSDEHPSARYDLEKKAWHCDACQAGGGILDLASKLGIDRPRLDKPTSERRVVATYDYTDAAGVLLFQVCRFEPKDFRQRRPDGNGGWLWNLAGVERVLYKLPDVLATVKAATKNPEDSAWIVVVVEGERDADTLENLGLVGTTSPMGAGKWTKGDYATSLRGGRVVVIPDNDEPGRAHAAEVAASLYGHTISLRVLPLPGGAKDLSEWVARGGTRDGLLELIAGTPEWKPDAPAIDRTRAMSAADFLSLDIPPAQWLVTGHLPEQAIGYIVGLPKAFKSYYAVEMAFSVANGASFLRHFEAGAPLKERRVLLVQFESSMPSFQGRIRAAAQRHGMPAGLHILSNVPVTLEDPASRERIERELEAIRPELLVLDPLAAMTTGDENSATEMGVVVRTLRGWRDTYGCAVMTVHHANKAKNEGGNTRAGLKMRGSTALYASSEATITIERPNDDEPRVHVRAEMKDGESPRPYVVEFSPADSSLSVTSSTIHTVVTDDDLVAAVAASRADGIDQKTLAVSLDLSERTVRDRMKSLLGTRLWVKSGTGVGRAPIVYTAKRT